MAGKVFFSVTMSLDGFVAPDEVSVEDVFSPEGQSDPRVQRWMAKWSELQAWIFPQRFFRENLKLGEGGEQTLRNLAAYVAELNRNGTARNETARKGAEG
jgi:hypothetical protein